MLLAVACSAQAAPVGSNSGAAAAKQSVEILNVSYDPTRELYQDFNAAFAKHWKQQENHDVTIKQSHGGSSAQSRAVIDGLEADVVTLALGYDIDALNLQAKLVPEDWQKRLATNSSPYTSTVVFVVRKGNPKGIKDWDDLVKSGVSVIPGNPKTSGGARWTYLAAWGYALKTSGSEGAARDFVARFYRNAPVLDAAARGTTNTFVERGIGDVLPQWENDAMLAIKDLGPDKFELVVPSRSILAEPSVAVVDRNVEKHGTRFVAQAYLDYLYSEEGQRIAAKHYYRPRMESVAREFEQRFARVDLFTLDEIVGSWIQAQRAHFNDGGIFDQIYQPGRS